MNWYHVKLVSNDPAGRKFFIEAESEPDVEERAEELFDELDIVSLDIHDTPVEDGLPKNLASQESTNIAFDKDNNRLDVE